jgi:phage shock protein C
VPHKMLYRSRENVMIAGVCAGIAEYFDIDPSLVRILTAALLPAGGASLLFYIVAWIIVPQQPVEKNIKVSTGN